MAVVRVIAEDVLVLGLVAVVVDMMVFSTRTLVLVSSVPAVVISVCVVAVGLAVVAEGSVVVFADVMSCSSADVSDVVIRVEPTEVVLLSAKV